MNDLIIFDEISEGSTFSGVELEVEEEFIAEGEIIPTVIPVNLTGAVVIMQCKKLNIVEATYSTITGTLIIIDNKIFAARCILPVSENPGFPSNYGMRHRAAVGMSENNDSLIVIVSEETGNIAIAEQGRLREMTNSKELTRKLEEEFSSANFKR